LPQDKPSTKKQYTIKNNQRTPWLARGGAIYHPRRKA
jgi:hypothetical protein